MMEHAPKDESAQVLEYKRKEVFEYEEVGHNDVLATCVGRSVVVTCGCSLAQFLVNDTIDQLVYKAYYKRLKHRAAAQQRRCYAVAFFAASILAAG